MQVEPTPGNGSATTKLVQCDVCQDMTMLACFNMAAYIDLIAVKISESEVKRGRWRIILKVPND